MPQTLDPALSADAGGAMVIAQLFTPLLVADPAGGPPQPGAASSIDPAPDQASFTLRLKPAAFHSGRAIDAGDIKYSIERVVRSGGPAAATLEDVKGARDFAARRDQSGITGITVVDDQTVRFELNGPDADFPAVLAQHALAPVPQEAVESASVPFSVAPVGNGPYRMARQWDQRGSIELIAAPGTVLAAGPAQRVRFVPYSDLGLGLTAYKARQLDAVSIPPTLLGSVKQEDGLTTSPFLGTYYFAFNLREAALAKPELRKAVAAAIDRNAIVRDVLKNSLTVRNGVVPGVFSGWPMNACGDLCSYNPRNAQALLVAAFPNGQVPVLNIDVDADPTQVAVATAMKSQLRAVGIPAEVRTRQFAEFRDFITGAGSAAPGLFRSGWVSGVASPSAFLAPLFLTGRPDNLTGFTNPDLDQLISELRREPDRAKRTEGYKTVEARVLADLPVIPIASLSSYWAIGRGVQGVTVSGAGVFEARTVTVPG